MMKWNQAFFTILLLGITSVSASPLELERRIDAQYSDFAKCIQQTVSGYPRQGTPTAQEMFKCASQGQSKAKRDEEELVYEPERPDPIAARGIIDTVTTLGKNLYLTKKPWCFGTKVHDEFVWVEDVKGRINDVCKQIRDQIDANGLRRDGGVGTVVDLLTNGHDKQGHQLKDNRKLTASYAISFIPPANMAVKEIKELANGVYDLCNDGLERITTKGEGCTQDIKYYRPSKAKHYTGTGAIGGLLKMFWGDDNVNPVATLNLDFTNDG